MSRAAMATLSSHESCYAVSILCCPHPPGPGGLTTSPAKENEAGKDWTQKLQTCYSLTSHWPELSHMAVPSCKGVWEM